MNARMVCMSLEMIATNADITSAWMHPATKILSGTTVTGLCWALGVHRTATWRLQKLQTTPATASTSAVLNSSLASMHPAFNATSQGKNKKNHMMAKSHAGIERRSLSWRWSYGASYVALSLTRRLSAVRKTCSKRMSCGSPCSALAVSSRLGASLQARTCKRHHGQDEALESSAAMKMLFQVLYIGRSDVSLVQKVAAFGIGAT